MGSDMHCSSAYPAKAAAADAAHYLQSQILPSGLFVYERDAAAPEWETGSYNLLRHCGCIYALLQHCDGQALDARIRLAGLAILDWLRPLPGQSETLAAWSLPAVNDTVDQEQVKLGATSLALLALTELNSVVPDLLEPDVLHRLALGIVAMQLSDGSFVSKLVPSDVEMRSSWQSLYYPGEAALALLRLARHQPLHADRWQTAALRGLEYLASSRQDAGADETPLDHWALIATAECLSQVGPHHSSSAALLRHACQIIDVMLARQIHDYSSPFLHGSFTRHGSTTTTATCLEGLLAIRPWIDDQLSLAAAVDQACDQGLTYLLKAQLQHGLWRGAIPSLAEPRPSAIRIDYVQHALSAFVGMAQRQQPSPRPSASRIGRAALFTPSEGLLTATICQEALDLGLQFMLAMVGPDGRVTYEVPLQPGPPDPSRHQVREAGGIWGLSLYLHRPSLADHQRQAIWNTLERAVHRLEAMSICQHGFRRPIPEDEPTGALGTAALSGLALVEMLAQADCPERQNRSRLLQELIAFILSCRQSSGRYHSRYNLQNGQPLDDPSPYFDGETVLLLAKAARVLGLTAYAVPASTGADAMFEAYAAAAVQHQQLSDDCKGFYQWGSMAMRELHLLQPGERRWGDRVGAMASWILDVHQVLTRRRNTGYAFEGLVSAYAVARDRGDQPQLRRLRAAIEQGLLRLCSWQLGSSLQNQALQSLNPHNPHARGGVIGGRKDTAMRIDTVQHQMHALLLAERELGL